MRKLPKTVACLWIMLAMLSLAKTAIAASPSVTDGEDVAVAEQAREFRGVITRSMAEAAAHSAARYQALLLAERMLPQVEELKLL